MVCLFDSAHPRAWAMASWEMQFLRSPYVTLNKWKDRTLPNAVWQYVEICYWRATSADGSTAPLHACEYAWTFLYVIWLRLMSTAIHPLFVLSNAFLPCLHYYCYFCERPEETAFVWSCWNEWRVLQEEYTTNMSLSLTHNSCSRLYLGINMASNLENSARLYCLLSTSHNYVIVVIFDGAASMAVAFIKRWRMLV